MEYRKGCAAAALYSIIFLTIVTLPLKWTLWKESLELEIWTCVLG